MSDKELEEYIRTINPNFDSHIEKWTIEMSNEYYNLLEEKMARLINENQELKKQLEERSKDYCNVSKIKHDYAKKLVIIKNQQKEFIEYLENEKDRLIHETSHHYTDSFDRQHAVNETIYDEVDKNLSKYKEIIGNNESN